MPKTVTFKRMSTGGPRKGGHRSGELLNTFVNTRGKGTIITTEKGRIAL